MRNTQLEAHPALKRFLRHAELTLTEVRAKYPHVARLLENLAVHPPPVAAPAHTLAATPVTAARSSRAGVS